MPGMPQVRDINEAGAKSVTLATVMDDGSVLLQERLTGVAQFERVTVELGGIEDWRDMVRALGRALGQVRDGVASEHLVARLHLTGSTTLAWRLRLLVDLLGTEAEDQAAALGKSWIDKVEVDCRAPGCIPGSAAPAEADPLEELRRLMREVTQDDAYHADIAVIAEELRAQLPPECRSLLSADAEAFAANLAEAARDGIEDVLARLRVGFEAESG
jgi:exonuclease SbcD